MPTPQPDPVAFGGHPDPSEECSKADSAPAPKRGLKGIWSATDGGPGPASWRTQKGKIHGLARRKGEKNPMKYGISFDASLLSHPRMANTEKLPPLKTPKNPSEPKTSEEKGKKCQVM